jgi:hypothetical protein
MTYISLVDNDGVSDGHPLFEWVEKLGWPRDQLVDPADLYPDIVCNPDLAPLTQVFWDSDMGPVEYTIDECALTHVHYGQAVAGIENTAHEELQPIGFEGALHSRLPSSREFFDESTHRLALFAVGERTPPTFTRKEALGFLHGIDAFTKLRREIVEALCEPFTVGTQFPYETDDRGEYIHAHYVTPALATAETGDAHSPDARTLAHGEHKQRLFSANLQRLHEEFQDAPTG